MFQDTCQNYGHGDSNGRILDLYITLHETQVSKARATQEKAKKRQYSKFEDLDGEEVNDERTHVFQKQKASSLQQQPAEKVRINLSTTSNLQNTLNGNQISHSNPFNSFADEDMYLPNSANNEDVHGLFEYFQEEITLVKQEVNQIKRMSSQLINMINGLTNAKFAKENDSSEKPKDSQTKKKIERNKGKEKPTTTRNQRGKSVGNTKKGFQDEKKGKKPQTKKRAVSLKRGNKN